MDARVILDKVATVVSRVLDADVSLTMETTADDIEDWDSITHIRIMVDIERAFAVNIPASEIAGFKNIGNLVRSIQRRL